MSILSLAKPKKHRNGLPLALAAGAVTLLSIPTAMAASLPGYGQFDLWSLQAIPVYLSIAGILAFFAGGRRFINKLPFGGMVTSAAGAFAVGGFLISAMILPGGVLNGTGDAADLSGTASATWDPALHDSASDVTFRAVDAETGSTINPTVKLYPSADGHSDKDIILGTATATYSGTMASGSVEITGVHVESNGCAWDAYLDLSGYYQAIFRDLDLCGEPNDEGNAKVSLPNLHLENIGTNSLSKTPTSLTCTDNTQCDYKLVFENSEADSYIQYAAIKFGTGNDAATLDGVKSGPCEIEEVGSTKYVVFTGDAVSVSNSELPSCVLHITDKGVGGGTFNLTADDNFGVYGASGWNTNANVKGASATSATEVTLA